VQTLKEQLERQKHEFSALFSGGPLTLEAGCDYCLLPAPWLATWRAYLTLGHKGGADEPTPLSQALEHLLCGEHAHSRPHLAFAAPMAVKKYAFFEPSLVMNCRGKFVRSGDSQP
jgi:hypothetical protein